jgi:cold-inducible RNA-binding protein
VKNIFVGNLSFGATEDSLRSMFESYGSVDRVNIVTDKETGQAEGDSAINGLNGRDLDGRTLNINEARPKADRASGGGGGYRGGGRSGGGGGGKRW